MSKNLSYNVANSPVPTNVAGLKPKLQVWKSAQGKSLVDHSASAFFELALECQRVIAEVQAESAQPEQALKVARKFIGELLLRESGQAEVTSSIAVFSSRYLAEFFIQEFLEELMLANADSELPAEQLLQHFEYFVNWYLTRARSLALLSLEPYPADSEEEVLAQIFDVNVLTDQSSCRVPGIYLSCALRLRGNAGQTLNLKCHVYDAYGIAEFHQDWAGWSEQTLPFVPLRQEQIIDRIQLFLPYAALETRQARESLFFNLRLLDSAGKELTRARSPEFIVSAASSELNLPSPGSLGIWPAEPGRGDLLQRLKARMLVRQYGERVGFALEVSFDASLVDQKGQKLGVALRVLNRAGEMLNLEEIPAGSGQHSHFEATLCPAHSRSIFSQQSLTMPLLPLTSRAENFEECLLELSIFERETGRILLGAVTDIENRCAHILDFDQCLGAPYLSDSGTWLSFKNEQLLCDTNLDSQTRLKLRAKTLFSDFSFSGNVSFLALVKSAKQAKSEFFVSNLICRPVANNSAPAELCFNFVLDAPLQGKNESLHCKLLALSENSEIIAEKTIELVPREFALKSPLSGKVKSAFSIANIDAKPLRQESALEFSVIFNLDPGKLNVPPVCRLCVKISDQQGRQTRFRKAVSQVEIIQFNANLYGATNALGNYQFTRKLRLALSPYLEKIYLKNSKDILCAFRLENLAGEALEEFIFPLSSPQ